MADPVFELFDTPHHREVGFKVPVSVSKFKTAMVPQKGDEYRAAKLIEKLYCNEYGAFVFSHVSIGPPGWIYYNYLQPVGADPEPFEEFTYQDDGFDWPDILEEFKIYCSDDNPRWRNIQQDLMEYLFVVRKRVRPAYRGVTNITVRRWWSHQPWAKEDFQAVPMIPNDIEYDLAVIRGKVPRVLHGAVKVPGLDGDGGSDRLYDLSSDTPGSTPIDAYPVRLYLPTNYETYEDHIFQDSQRPIRGGYMREQLEAEAPPLPDIEET